MNDLNQTPPIPSPTERSHSVPVVRPRKDWQDAPQVVKGWAYVLTWFSIVLIPLAIFITIVTEDSSKSPELKIAEVFLYSLAWIISIWHNRALKKGASYAWTTQIVFSVMGLCGIPLGTVLNLYILSQWFKPETKSWFGKE